MENTRQGITGVKHIKDTKRKGDFAEYYAVTWLWDKGYEVFQNSGCSGLIDMIAVDKDGTIILIDVKTAKQDKRRKNKYVNVSGGSRTEEQKKLGVKFLSFNPDTRQLSWVKHKT